MNDQNISHIEIFKVNALILKKKSCGNMTLKKINYIRTKIE